MCVCVLLIFTDCIFSYKIVLNTPIKSSLLPVSLYIKIIVFKINVKFDKSKYLIQNMKVLQKH